MTYAYKRQRLYETTWYFAARVYHSDGMYIGFNVMIYGDILTASKAFLAWAHGVMIFADNVTLLGVSPTRIQTIENYYLDDQELNEKIGRFLMTEKTSSACDQSTGQ